jgi:hypothetical protein
MATKAMLGPPALSDPNHVTERRHLSADGPGVG